MEAEIYGLYSTLPPTAAEWTVAVNLAHSEQVFFGFKGLEKTATVSMQSFP